MRLKLTARTLSINLVRSVSSMLNVLRSVESARPSKPSWTRRKQSNARRWTLLTRLPNSCRLITVVCLPAARWKELVKARREEKEERSEKQ